MGRMATRRTPPSGNRRSRGLLVTDSGQLRKKKEAVKLVTNANRKRRGLLRRINPKACRKKAGSSADVASTVAVTTNRSRMSNFRSCLKKKTTTTRKTANNEKVTARSKFGQKCGANSAAGRKSQSVVTLVQKEKKESSKKSRSTKMVTSSSVTRMGSSSTTTTTSTVIALISTSTTSSSADSSSTASLVGVGASSRQVAIAMYQEHQENVDHHPAMASSPKTSCKNLQKTGRTKMTCDLQHMVESIERVASGQPWIDTLVTSDKTGGESSSSDSSSASSSSTSSSSSSSSSESSSSKSSEQSSSKGRRRKKTNRSIHLRNRSVKRNEPSGQSPPPVGSLRRPNQRRRLACLNAMAKVHCLYESEIRHPLAQKQHATRIFSSASDSDQSGDDCSSSSNSSSSDSSEENETAIDKAVDNKNKKIVSNKSSANARKKEASRSRKSEKKRPAAKAPATGKKQRQSMEVAPVDLAALVMPKRMASLNATAILAASSQQWPDSPKPRRGKAQPRSLSSSDADSADEVQRETKVIPSPKTQRPTGKSKRLPTLNKKKKPALTKITKNISCVESCSTSTAVSTSTNSHILRLSANIFHHQEVDGHQQTTTTTKSNTYHQSSSGSEQNGNSVTSSSKTYQRQVTTTSSDCGPRSSPMDVIQPVSRVAPAHQRPTQQAKQQPTVQTDAQDSYSPLGALYNMRPPNLQQQQQERTPSRHQDQQHHHPAGGTTSEVSSSPNSSFQTSGNNSSGGHNMTKDRDKGWSSERVAATSLPSVSFGGVPLVLSNPIQAAESYMTAAARLTPAFSLYRPPVDIPYASFYPPPPPLYSAAHFAAPSYYRGFALLPPPGSGFVPVALADSYSAYALAAPSPFVGSTNAELAHYLHRYQTLGPPPCSPLTRYLPTASPCGLGPDWRLARDSSRSVVELPSSSSMHDDRNPLPLAATEATASGSGNSSSVGGVSGTPANGNNTCPKVEAGSTASSAHPSTMLPPPSSTRSFFPFAGGAPMVGSAAAATAYASRCLNANCSCSGQSSPTCPKNALAGPLTGEGKRSGPNSISHSVIPHPSSQVALVQPPIGGAAGSSSSSPAVPSLLPELLLHATGPLETAADPQPTSTSNQNDDFHRDDSTEKLEKQNNNNNNNNNHNDNNRKKKSLSSVFPPSPVSSRLRSRISSNSGCSVENCSKTCCCHCVSEIGNARHLAVDNNTRLSESLSLTSSDSDPNEFVGDGHSTLSCHSQEMKKYKRLGSDVITIELDKISGRKRHKNKLQHPGDLTETCGEQFDDQSLLTSDTKAGTKNGTARKCRDKLILPDVVKSRVMIDPHKKMATKKTIKSMNRTKEYLKMVRATSPVVRLLTDNTNAPHPTAKLEPRRGGSKSRSPLVPPVSSTSPVLRWSNGWSWEGNSFQSLVHLRNEDLPAVRKCYPAMRHTQGDIVRMRDCILLKSGPKAKDLPFVAKVSALWENADDGEMMMSLLWYYRPEHTEGGRRVTDLDDEIFASRHRDVCSVACIEDKCYVLTFNEYCRYRKRAKMMEQGVPPPFGAAMSSVTGETPEYPRRLRLPPTCTPTTADRVFLCRKVYDFRQKRILKNPS
uniref:Bromo adjacent domain-containing 1 protein n=1 Tax=Daphnia magna TaxID=35525 RepID=A0A0P5QQJ9_9CRUS